jgi:hypothetical protein
MALSSLNFGTTAPKDFEVFGADFRLSWGLKMWTVSRAPKMNFNDDEWRRFELSKKPPMTVGGLLDFIDNSDEESRTRIAGFIGHRLEGRYIRPQLHVSPGYRSGFSMMASACLLIEALQSFYEGADKTPAKWGSRYFANFFQRERVVFPCVENKKDDFYIHVRCGILHQAETTGGYRVLLKGPLFDPAGSAYNAEVFLSTLQCSVRNYVAALRTSTKSSAIWKSAVNKLHFICLNCRKAQ